MYLLDKIFQKRGIRDINDLTKEEKAVVDSWESEWKAILSAEEELNIDTIKNFCQNQLKIIEGKWGDYSVEEKRKQELLPYYTVYKTLLNVINLPRSAREAFEKKMQKELEK